MTSKDNKMTRTDYRSTINFDAETWRLVHELAG
jgi:hypothetical protein